MTEEEGGEDAGGSKAEPTFSSEFDAFTEDDCGVEEDADDEDPFRISSHTNQAKKKVKTEEEDVEDDGDGAVEEDDTAGQ